MRGEDVDTSVSTTYIFGSPPHARGRPIGWKGVWRLGGSPPHARGRHLKIVVGNFLRRITPACAGKTQSPGWQRSNLQDHPRMRGEDGRRENVNVPHCGSPPHARGRPSTCRRPASQCRITPACAGKTGALMHFFLSAKDGSPPHARGRQRLETSSVEEDRITPACAGKTGIIVIARIVQQDHPRMRGEDQHVDLRVRPSHGSPPHARGRLSFRCRPDCRGGITPACAGKTSSESRGQSSSTDHPRMRGEDIHASGSTLVRDGSPPHARGRHGNVSAEQLIARITPACAGKTAKTGNGQGRSRDHPRMRGEDLDSKHSFLYDAGSPPHARGRPPFCPAPVRPAGITPACAGKTPR